jgi:small subunit ribosomal protein S16
MATKIRLQRHGKKGKPFYHVVVADSRAPRDGKFIERIGSYNPNTNPATIDLNFERALDWVLKGAQPTDTTRTILSQEGVLYKKHLLGGVNKGAFDAAAAESKFQAWVDGKSTSTEGKKEQLAQSKAAAKSEALAAERKKKEEIAAAVQAKNTPAAEEVAEEAAEEPVSEGEASTEATAESEEN